MLETLVAIGPLFFLLVTSELLWRTRLLRGEAARKLLHIIIGSYIASWPYFMTFEHIQWVVVAMLVGVAISHKYHIFHAINDVKRHTWGDILYAVGLLVAATFAKQPWVFALAVLHMSVADGMAGLIGSQYGNKHTYKILGSKKSLIGTVSFIVVSYGLMMLFTVARPGLFSSQATLLVPLVAAALENLGPRGSDNVAIPLFIVLFFA